MSIHTRTPETFSPPGATGPPPAGRLAWVRGASGDLEPSGLDDLDPGQAWEGDESEIAPAGDESPADPYWAHDGDETAPQ